MEKIEVNLDYIYSKYTIGNIGTQAVDWDFEECFQPAIGSHDRRNWTNE